MRKTLLPSLRSEMEKLLDSNNFKTAEFAQEDRLIPDRHKLTLQTYCRCLYSVFITVDKHAFVL